nr:MAG: hypothetical protein [Lokiarchaeota virus Ratatoskr Meg22_1012]
MVKNYLINTVKAFRYPIITTGMVADIACGAGMTLKTKGNGDIAVINVKGNLDLSSQEDTIGIIYVEWY